MTTSQAHVVVVTGLAIAALSLPMLASAADASLVTAAAVERLDQKTAQPSAAKPPLDLRAPPIEQVMSQQQIAEVLARTFAPRNMEEVKVDSSRLHDPASEAYIPPGLASLIWATGHPTGLMRLFIPQETRRSRAIVDATRQAGPPAAIPAMAGEIRHYDR